MFKFIFIMFWIFCSYSKSAELLSDQSHTSQADCGPMICDEKNIEDIIKAIMVMHNHANKSQHTSVKGENSGYFVKKRIFIPNVNNNLNGAGINLSNQWMTNGAFESRNKFNINTNPYGNFLGDRNQTVAQNQSVSNPVPPIHQIFVQSQPCGRGCGSMMPPGGCGMSYQGPMEGAHYSAAGIFGCIEDCIGKLGPLNGGVYQQSPPAQPNFQNGPIPNVRPDQRNFQTAPR